MVPSRSQRYFLVVAGGFVQDVPELVNGELRIDRYEVEAKLGEGGMAEVWLCRLRGARGFSKQVVIKTIKPACRNENYESMFVDEATIGARLEHPNVPRVTEFAQTASGVLYLVQEYVEGPSVQQLVAAQRAIGRYDLRLATRIASDVAKALDFAYRLRDERGRPLEVIHRDVSTTNILVSRRGPAKLIDFGVARFSDRSTETQTGILKGKLQYMAPELVSAGRPSHRSDLYSLGQVLYRMCVGQRPGGVLGSSEFVAPAEAQPDIDPALESIILACLQPNPDARIANGELLAQRLDRWAFAHGGPVTDAESAARISALFPPGSTEWAPTEVIDGDGPARPATPPPRSRVTTEARSRAGRAVVLATFGLGLLVAVVLTLVTVIPWDGSEARSPGDATVENLLESSRVALDEGRFADAEALWAESTQITKVSDALRAEREALTTEIRLYQRLRELRELAAREPAEARVRAQHLLREHPERADVAALADELANATASRD